MTDPVEVAASAWDVMVSEEMENTRTCQPIHVTGFAPAAASTCEGIGAIPDQLPDGTPGESAQLTTLPIWYPGGAGFYMRWPLEVGDIALGVVSDRSLAAWSLQREPGEDSAPPFPHFHNVSDTQVLPVTDRPGIPEDDPGISTDFVIGGPAGVAIRVEADGVITLTTAAATITVAVDGTVTIDSPTIKLGGAAAVLGVARLTDDVAPTAGMATFMASVVTALGALSAGAKPDPIPITAPVPPATIGAISSASSTSLSE